ncbi:MFS transporter [Pseudorhodobacter sp. MZDSW-24AT]|uniref:MFS transporter n=1 Tax=Pseudorhodobacter sp. MZDSW-24AT TaxID=2052957 RepID=UPI000C1E5F00|nr:MFS transporter [Pseudorhodobacter sp. MZDSW-24AT]PJF09191.1 MFS transporter [Pseudorhodobacter sp. MZDSW-24AT]
MPHILTVARAPLAAFAAMGVVWGGFAAALPDIKTQLGVDEAQLGLMLLFSPIAAVTAMLLAPAFGAAMGRLALPMAALTMGLGMALPGQAASLVLFPLAIMVCGAGTGLTDVLMNARVAELENTRKIHLMNLCHAAYSFGYAGAAIGTGVMRGAGWSPAWVLGSMALVAAALALTTWEQDGQIDGLRKPKGPGAAGLGLLPLLGGAVVLIAFMTENAAEAWSALHIEKTLGGSPEQGALGPAALALTMGFARLAGQGLVARVNPYRLMTGGAVIAALGAMLAATAQTPLMAYTGFIVMGLGASVIAPTAFSLVGRLARPEARARAVARATLFGYCGYFFGPPLLGFIAGGFGLRWAFVFAACLLLVVLVLSPLMARRAR